MRFVLNEELTEKQLKIFSVSNEIYERTIEFVNSKITELSNVPEFTELQDYEVISFMMNLNTKIFCHIFMLMITLKNEHMKEFEGTKDNLLIEGIDGIYRLLDMEKPKLNSESKSDPKRIMN